MWNFLPDAILWNRFFICHLLLFIIIYNYYCKLFLQTYLSVTISLPQTENVTCEDKSIRWQSQKMGIACLYYKKKQPPSQKKMFLDRSDELKGIFLYPQEKIPFVKLVFICSIHLAYVRRAFSSDILPFGIFFFLWTRISKNDL